MFIETRFYKQVASSSVETNECILASNEKIYLTEFGGNAVYSKDVKVEIIWDTTILLATHGDTVQKTAEELIGDGIKILKIVLTNDSEQAETVGGYYMGEKYIG